MVNSNVVWSKDKKTGDVNSDPVSSFDFESSMTVANSSSIGIFAIAIDAIVF